MIKKADFTFPEFEHPPQLSQELQTLIRNCIQLKPEKRLTLPKILGDPWLKELNSSSDEDLEEEEEGNKDESKDTKEVIKKEDENVEGEKNEKKEEMKEESDNKEKKSEDSKEMKEEDESTGEKVGEGKEEKDREGKEKPKDEDKEKKDEEDEEIDFQSISGNINFVNVDNLFYGEDYKVKLSYTNYCCITEDFTTKQLDDSVIKLVEGFGFPRDYVL